MVSFRQLRITATIATTVLLSSCLGGLGLSTLVALQYVPMIVGAYSLYDSLSTDEGEFSFNVATAKTNSLSKGQIVNAKQLVVLPIQSENMGALVDTVRSSANLTIVSPSKINRWLGSRGLRLDQMPDREKFRTIQTLSRAHGAQLALLVETSRHGVGYTLLPMTRTRTITSSLVSTRSGDIIWSEKQKIRPKGLAFSGEAAYLYGPEILNHALSGTMERLSKIRGTYSHRIARHVSESVRATQTALNSKGYSAGTADGLMGPNTREAIRHYQKDQGMPVTGELDEFTLESLGI